MMPPIEPWITEVVRSFMTAAGFFWKAGWAFVLGYFISAMIQVFVPKKNLVRQMGPANIKSVGLSTLFGSVSSSCSFAALAAARSLMLKGAHFITSVAFMFASTNLVIELGILILIFLGWQFLVAEIIGGLLLILISSHLIHWTYPKAWVKQAREKLSAESGDLAENFDWRDRFFSWQGWAMVGRQFVMEWKMVWKEIAFGFTVAGFMAVMVPDSFWQALFLADNFAATPNDPLLVLQNAMIAPFVAAATFIGSMGNIPLATVLNTGGVSFAGLMGFIYSDLMVPPLVKVNAKYYGWKLALYIAVIMYASIVVTAVILHTGFAFFDVLPQSARRIEDVSRFEIDYTFFMNLIAVILTGAMIYLKRQDQKD